jgi:hypothetical protein
VAVHPRGAAGGRLLIAIDGKTVRGAKDRTGKAPHLAAALAHGIGAVLGQVAVDAKPNEIPAVPELLKVFTSLAGAVITIGAMHTQAGRPAGCSVPGFHCLFYWCQPGASESYIDKITGMNVFFLESHDHPGR